MLKIYLKYFFSFIICTIIGILILDYILIPNYVGYNNEHYLPDIRGEYIEKANYELKRMGFNIDIKYAEYNINNEPGIVLKMFPRAFTKVKEGRTINITIAGSIKEIIMPDLIELSLRSAKLELQHVRLNIDTIIYEYDNFIKKGLITFQIPKSDKVIQSSNKITLGVSRGLPPDYYIVPDLVNLSLHKGKKDIIKSGLKIGDIIFEYQPDLLKNTIIEQNYTAGMRISFPASINLIVTTDFEEIN